MLRNARWSRALPQRRLGAQLGMAEVVVSRWEIGSELPSTGAFIRWAHALGYVVHILDRSQQPMADRPTPRQSETFEAYEVRRIAAALRRARLEADHTQNALCAALHVSEWTIRMWESARRQPRIIHLIIWAEVLECRVVLISTA
jgi:transcriptional regulator with XRE-family HTH domain